MKKVKNILIVVDMQNDIIDGALGTKEAVAIVPNVIARIKQAAKDGDIIFATQDTHWSDTYLNSEEGKNLPVKHCIFETDGWNINKSVNEALCKADKYSFDFGVSVFNKGTFGSKALARKLDEFDSVYSAYEIKNIELVGLCTDICVISNAIVAKTVLPNAHIIVDAACCAGVTPESHDTALDAMKALQIEVKNRDKEPWRV